MDKGQGENKKNPARTAFPVIQTSRLIRGYNTHAQFLKKADLLSSAAKPAPSTKDVEWTDWTPSFLNYLPTISGKDEHPLEYIYREYDAPDPTPNPYFMDDYVAMAPLTGKAFNADAA